MVRSGKINKILVIKLSALGDFIQALGPMAAIRKHHSDAHITLITTALFKEFAQSSGYFDDIWLDERPGITNLLKWLKLKKQLNGGDFDRVYDLQNNDRTSFYFRLFCGKTKPEWVGVAKGASHRNTSPDRTAGHAFDGHVQTLKLAGIKDIEIDRLEWINENILSFPLKKPYVLLIPGSSPEHPGKRWPVEKYGKLAAIIAGLGYQPIIIATGSDGGVAQEIIKTCPEALDLTDQTSFSQIATLAKGAAAVIGNDTGPMHLAAATGCPCLVLFSRHSNPVKHAPKGEHIWIVQKENLQDLEIKEILDLFEPNQKIKKQSATVH